MIIFENKIKEYKNLEYVQLFKNYEKLILINRNHKLIYYFKTKKTKHILNNNEFKKTINFEIVDDHFEKNIYNFQNDIINQVFIKNFYYNEFSNILKYLKDEIFSKLLSFNNFDINFILNFKFYFKF